jgi:leucyl aminopeptidase
MLKLTYSKNIEIKIHKLEEISKVDNISFFYEKNKSLDKIFDDFLDLKNLLNNFFQTDEFINFFTYDKKNCIYVNSFACNISKSVESDFFIKKILDSLIKRVEKNKIENLNLIIFKGQVEDNFHQCFLENLIYLNYNFNKYFKEKESCHKKFLKSINIFTNDDLFSKNLNISKNLMKGVTVTRDLVSEPSNYIYPEKLVEISSLLKNFGIEVLILNKEEMKKEGMNLLLSVGKASHYDPYMVIFKWHGEKEKDFNENLISILGKGVTFDSGGLNIKSNSTNMKTDMAGAAAIIGTMISIAKNNVKKNVLGVIGLVENMICGNSFKPDDVIFSMSGKTVEIDNTDAEGRLVLADIISYVQKYFKPSYMIDLATLTGAISVCLGNYYAGLFCNDEDFSKSIIESSKKTQDRVWRLPIDDYYDKLNDSSIADIKNCAREVGSVTAACFLKKFIDKSIKWAHIDIAGVAFLNKYSYGDTSTAKATGFGVKLLHDLISNYL